MVWIQLVDTSTQAGQALVHMDKLCDELKNKAEILMFAKFCIERSKVTKRNEQGRWYWFLDIKKEGIPLIQNNMKGLVNEHLMQVGLELTKYSYKNAYAYITVTVMD